MATKKEVASILERLNWIEKDKAMYSLAEDLYKEGKDFFSDYPCDYESAHKAYVSACHRTSELQIVLDILGVTLNHNWGRYDNPESKWNNDIEPHFQYELYDIWSIAE